MGDFPGKNGILAVRADQASAPFECEACPAARERGSICVRETAMPESEKYRIKVEAVAEFVASQSDPDDSRYVFAYHITLTNVGGVTAQLISRHWVITDGTGKTQEVRGLGVIGEQPVLAPGQQFTYSSGSVIETPVGTMHGSYQMTAEDGHRFDAEIPAFMLAMPRVLH
jgi:ApaG protein